MTIAILIGALAIALAIVYQKKEGKNYLNAQDINEKTTFLPLPIEARMCTHDWTTVTDEVLETDFEKKKVVIMSCHNCGVIDKTIEVVCSKCKHEWKREHEIELVSPYDQLNMDARNYFANMDIQNSAMHWFQQKVLLVFTCEHCGEIYSVTEST